MMSGEVIRNEKGYYSLYVDGVFEGNFDTYMEAVHEMEEIMYPSHK